MTFNLSDFGNLPQRIITAITGAVIILAGSALHQWTYFAIFFIICTLSITEFYRLTGLDGMHPLRFFGTMNALLMFTVSFLVEAGYADPKYYFVLFPTLSLVFLIKLYKKEEKPFSHIAYTFLGIIYVGLPFSLLNYTVFAPGTYNSHIVIGLMLILWASDVGAYFIGIRFGKTKLFERISPKKSWEGMIGGFALSIAMATGIAVIYKDLSLLNWYIFALIIVITGTYGDLVESLFKRSISIKDSGNSLPGHGGFLDRFDGLLIALSYIVFYLKVFVY